MNMHQYGITGRLRRPDNVGAIEAMRPYLAYKKEQSDLADYREKTLALEKDRIDAEEKANTRASIIGLGKLGAESYFCCGSRC